MEKPGMLRVKFSSKRESKKFFGSLTVKLGCNTLKELSRRLSVPYGRLKLWARNERTIPLEIAEEWKMRFGISAQDFRHKLFDLHLHLQMASKKGCAKLKENFGENWSEILGARSIKSLHKRLAEDLSLRAKWRSSIVAALKKKYGETPYKELGKLGGPKSIRSVPKEVMAERLKKAFRKSFRNRIIYFGRRFRSSKEVEVARILRKLALPYEYEKYVSGYYPDFTVKAKTIIEVVGFDWRMHVDKTKLKLEKYKSAGFEVAVYTYPNMEKYFQNSGILVFTNAKELEGFLNLKAGYSLA